MSNRALTTKDANAAMEPQQVPGKDVKSMEYHRQVFHSKIAQEETYAAAACPQRLRHTELTSCDRTNKYISPSDNIMSPCTAKINALRNKHASKYVVSLQKRNRNERCSGWGEISC